MEIRNRADIEFIDDTCGKIQELHHSENLSISYVTLIGKAKSHMHKKMEEVYYVVKGRGVLYISEESQEIKPNDIISIPKDIFHHLEKTSEEPLEVMVVTYPKYDVSDVIEE